MVLKPYCERNETLLGLSKLKKVKASTTKDLLELELTQSKGKVSTAYTVRVIVKQVIY